MYVLLYLQKNNLGSEIRLPMHFQTGRIKENHVFGVPDGTVCCESAVSCFLRQISTQEALYPCLCQTAGNIYRAWRALLVFVVTWQNSHWSFYSSEHTMTLRKDPFLLAPGVANLSAIFYRVSGWHGKQNLHL